MSEPREFVTGFINIMFMYCYAHFFTLHNGSVIDKCRHLFFSFFPLCCPHSVQ